MLYTLIIMLAASVSPATPPVPLVGAHGQVGVAGTPLPPERPSAPTLISLLAAIRQVESGGSRDPAHAVGDKGLAWGWYQQHQAQWQEGCDEIGVDWPWPESTADRAKCEAVIIGYWRRHAAKYLASKNLEELARRFRLPYAPYRPDNDAYWNKVRANLEGGK